MDVSVRDLKARLSEYRGRVKGGEEVVITHQGEPVGPIVPIEQEQATPDAELVQHLRNLPWIRAGRGGEFLGARLSLPHRPGEKTLSEIVMEDRG